MKSFYITTTLPYVNAEAHMGHALEFVRADAVARWHELLGEDVFFNTGTDEHGQKVYTAAKKEGRELAEYVDSYAIKFKDLLPKLGITDRIHFIRTTDEHHVRAAQEFWKRVDQNGYIYKKNYKANYCVGCESEKTNSELDENGHCLLHPNLEIQVIEEENYFFKFSEFGDKLIAFYDTTPGFIIPEARENEMREFIKRGLQDFSISRLKEKMSWGVPVPGDEAHVMYVWFDALTNYISTLGWPENEADFKKYWIEGTPVQYCGKDNTRFQSVMWQAMLMAADLPNSRHIVVDGFVTADGGVKMSKSLGNVVNPLDVVSEYGTDALRYFLLRELSTFEDSPFTIDRFKEAYNANLANGLGNLTSRIMKMADTNLEGPVPVETALHETLKDLMNGFEVGKAMDHIWGEIGELDRTIQEKEPFKLVKSDPEAGKQIITELVQKLAHIGASLAAFMPDTSEKILAAIKANKLEAGLFPRKD